MSTRPRSQFDTFLRFHVFAYRLATRTESPPTLARRQILTKEFYSCRLVLSSPPPVFHYAPQSQFFSILALKISNMFLPHLLVVFFHRRTRCRQWCELHFMPLHRNVNDAIISIYWVVSIRKLIILTVRVLSAHGSKHTLSTIYGLSWRGQLFRWPYFLASASAKTPSHRPSLAWGRDTSPSPCVGVFFNRIKGRI